MTKYQYNLKQQYASSDKYGKCEVCGKFVSDVHSQSKERRLMFAEKEHWIQDGITFGHKECLIKIWR